MNRIDTVTIEDALPRVFAAESDNQAIRDSEVWLSTLRLVRPERYMIEAVSGAGKTSLCAFLFGQRQDYSGVIRFNDIDIRQFSIRDWCDVRRQHLAYLPQEPGLFGELTAMDNILVKNRLTDRYTEREIMEMLTLLGVEHKAQSPARLLSVGQGQRVALVRALCQPFDFLLLDEPVSHLDAQSNSAAAELVLRVVTDNNAGVIATSVGNPIMLDNISSVQL